MQYIRVISLKTGERYIVLGDKRDIPEFITNLHQDCPGEFITSEIKKFKKRWINPSGFVKEFPGMELYNLFMDKFMVPGKKRWEVAAED